MITDLREQSTPGSALVPQGAPAPKVLKPWQEQKLEAKLLKMEPALRVWRSGGSDKAIDEMIVSCLGVSMDTAERYRKLLKTQGVIGLAERHQGRRPQSHPWELRAQALMRMPGITTDAQIASKLRQEGWCKEMKRGSLAKKISRLRAKTPANQAEQSKEKLGWHYHWQNRSHYARRDWREVPVGYRYEVDGHTCDFYLEDPNDGGYFQPELTLWMDVRSRCIVGFRLGRAESSAELRYSLSDVIEAHGHVPCEIHLDHGAGKAEEFTDAISGYCTKLGIHPEFAKARNARSKIIEGEFARFKREFSAFQPCYLGREDDFFRDFRRRWAKGDIKRVTVYECYQLLLEYFYNYRNQEEMVVQGERLVPATLFATLEKNPPLASADAISRPREVRTVRSRCVEIHKRSYHAEALEILERREVLVEFSEFRPELVWIYTMTGEFITVAELVRERPGIAANVIAERMAQRKAGQLKRLEIRRADIEGKSRPLLTAASVIDALETADALPAPAPAAIELTFIRQGHSFGPASEALPALSSPPPAAPRRRMNAEQQQRLRDAFDEPAPEIPAEPHNRFRLWRSVTADMQAGTPVAESLVAWAAAYETLPECIGYRAALDDLS